MNYTKTKFKKALSVILAIVTISLILLYIFRFHENGSASDFVEIVTNHFGGGAN